MYKKLKYIVTIPLVYYTFLSCSDENPRQPEKEVKINRNNLENILSGRRGLKENKKTYKSSFLDTISYKNLNKQTKTSN